MSTDSNPWEGSGGRVKAILEARNRTMRSLADATGVPYKSLQNYLRGTSPFPAEVVARIAQELNVSADWLIFGVAARFNQATLFEALKMLRTVSGDENVADDVAMAVAVTQDAKIFAATYQMQYEGNVAPKPPEWELVPGVPDVRLRPVKRD